MDHANRSAAQSCLSDQKVEIERADGSIVSGRLMGLSNDCCELECEHPLARGEQIGIRLFRMGSIRARVTSEHRGLIITEFIKECPV